MKFAYLGRFKEGKAIILINIAVIAALVWTITLWAGQIVSARMVAIPSYTPPQTSSRAMAAPPADYVAIKRRNLFYPAAPQSPGQGAGEILNSTLPFKLVGTILAAKKKESVAILESTANREQNLYHVGDTLAQGAFITAVNRFEVIVTNNGRLERIAFDFGEAPGAAAASKARGGYGALPPGTQVAKLGDNQVVIDKGFFETQKGNMNDLMTQIRAVPNMAADGSIDGFQVFEIVKESVYDKIGLKNQDVIHRVNGQALTSVEGGLDLFNALKNDNRFVIDVVRNNQNKTITVDVQ